MWICIYRLEVLIICVIGTSMLVFSVPGSSDVRWFREIRSHQLIQLSVYIIDRCVFDRVKDLYVGYLFWTVYFGNNNYVCSFQNLLCTSGHDTLHHWPTSTPCTMLWYVIAVYIVGSFDFAMCICIYRLEISKLCV